MILQDSEKFDHRKSAHFAPESQPGSNNIVVLSDVYATWGAPINPVSNSSRSFSGGQLHRLPPASSLPRRQASNAMSVISAGKAKPGQAYSVKSKRPVA